MKIAACSGAITDYMDLQPYAKKLIASFDRQFLLYEATVLSFTIATIGRGSEESNQLLVKLAEELASGKLPHEIEGASEYAQSHAARSAELISIAKKNGRKVHENFAYIVTKESSTGNVANFLVGRVRCSGGSCDKGGETRFLRDFASLDRRVKARSREDNGTNNDDLGTSGGGHPHASGARIRRGSARRISEFARRGTVKSPHKSGRNQCKSNNQKKILAQISGFVIVALTMIEMFTVPKSYFVLGSIVSTVAMACVCLHAFGPER